MRRPASAAAHNVYTDPALPDVARALAALPDFPLTARDETAGHVTAKAGEA